MLKKVAIAAGGLVLVLLFLIFLSGSQEYADTDVRELDRAQLFHQTEKLLEEADQWPAELSTDSVSVASSLEPYPVRTVRYTVDTRGRVDELEVLSADPGKTFEATVRKAIRRWRHEPYLADGEPVAASVTRTFEFAIRNEPLAAGEKPATGCRRVTGSRLCRSKDAYQELGIVVVHNPL